MTVIAGIVLAAILALGTHWYLDRRKEIAAGRAAARVIADELVTASTLIAFALVEGVWPDDPEAVIFGSAWEQHRAALAAAPGFKGWYPVTGATDWLLDVRRRVQQADVKRGSPSSKGNLPREFLIFGLKRCEIADEALQDYAKTKSYKSEKVKEFQRMANGGCPVVRRT